MEPPEVRSVLAAIRPLWREGLPALTNDDLKALLLSSELPGLRDAITAARESARAAATAIDWADLVVSRCEGSPLGSIAKFIFESFWQRSDVAKPL
jgi:hypothetical protein